MKKTIITLGVTIAVMASSLTMVFADSCGRWQHDYADKAKCYSTWCYNINPLRKSWGQLNHQKRQCVRNDNSTYWDKSGSYMSWDGCCQ